MAEPDYPCAKCGAIGPCEHDDEHEPVRVHIHSATVFRTTGERQVTDIVAFVRPCDMRPMHYGDTAGTFTAKGGPRP